MRNSITSQRTAEPVARTSSEFAHRHDTALAVLTVTRGVVARGWVQHAWYVRQAPAGRRPTRHRFFPGAFDHRQVVGACLVGAVLHGAWQLSPRAEYAWPAVDALWHSLFDPETDPVGPLMPPLVRAARVRDLTTWNDRDYRTREQVLDLVDATAARLSYANR